MAIRKIDEKDWQTYFDGFSKSFLTDKQPEYAEMQVLSEAAGVQPETSWLPLRSISYDARSKMLNIKLEELGHTISNPSEIYVDEDSNGLISSMEIVEKDGTKSIIEIR